eukprot:jgi/Botrbrau1/7973/Bobra.384_2s0001.1
MRRWEQGSARKVSRLQATVLRSEVMRMPQQLRILRLRRGGLRHGEAIFSCTCLLRVQHGCPPGGGRRA